MITNEVKLIGNLVREPETFSSSKGDVGKIRIACNTRRGETEDTLYIDVKLFGRTFDDLAYYEIDKGDKIVAQGRLVIEEWTDKDGNKRREPVVYANSVMKFHRKTKATNGF